MMEEYNAIVTQAMSDIMRDEEENILKAAELLSDKVTRL